MKWILQIIKVHFFIKEAGINLNDDERIVSIVTSLLAAYTDSYRLYQGTKSGVEYYSKAASKELHGRGLVSIVVLQVLWIHHSCMVKKLNKVLHFSRPWDYMAV